MKKGFLGLDVSKGYCDFCLMDESGKELEKVFQLDDTRRGHDKLKAGLSRLMKKHKLDQIDCAVESTGGYEDHWYDSLLQWSTDQKLRVARLNPSVVKNSALAELRPDTTDGMSARNIASYMRRYSDQVNFSVRSNQFAALRSLFGHYQLHVKQQTQLISQFKQMVYLISPELQRFCKQSVPNWVLEVCQKFPTAEKLAHAKASKLMEIKSVTKEKAEKLIENARKSLSTRKEESDAFLIIQLAKEIQHKEEIMGLIRSQLTSQSQSDDVKLLQSIKGVGAYSAVVFMILIEDISRFETSGQLCSYFGLHPTLKESGDKKGKSRMSKRGKAAMRSTLYMCAHSAVMFDPHMKEIYKKHRTRGMNHKQAIGVIMHKLLRVIFGILKSKNPYDYQIDIDNQKKNITEVSVTEANEIDSKRRYQDFDEDAPISRINHRIRKVHTLSQAENNVGQMRDLVHEPYEVQT